MKNCAQQPRTLKIVILGCGRIGSTLAYWFDRDGHEVTVIDKDATAFRRLPKDFGGRVVEGWGIDPELMEQIELSRADVFLAVTNGDNTNIMASQLAKERFGVKRVVARVYDPLRAYAYKELGLDTLCTSILSAAIFYDYILGREWRNIEDYLKLVVEER